MHKPGINIDERRGSRVDGSVEVERRETPTNYLEIEDGHLSKIHLTRYFPYFCWLVNLFFFSFTSKIEV